MVLALCRGGVIEIRRRIDRKARRGLLQDLFGAVELTVAQQRAAKQGEGRAGCCRIGTNAFERLERFVERRAIVARFGILEPDAPERLVHEGLVWRALQGGPERDHSRLSVPGPGLGQPYSDLTLDVIAVESRDDLQLVEFVGAAVLRGGQVCQLLACGNETRRNGDGLFECVLRLDHPRSVAKTQTQQVIRLGRAVVQAHGPGRRGDRRIEFACAITRQRQFVADARRAVVERERAFVGLGRTLVSLHLVEHVAEPFERARSGRIEGRRFAKVVRSRVEIAAPLVRFAAAEPREHRIGAQSYGAGVRLDRAEGLVVGERGIPAGQELLVRPVAGDRLVHDDAGRRDRQDDDKEKRTTHPARYGIGTFRLRRCLNCYS